MLVEAALRLLIVDDEAPARDLLRVICAEQGVSVIGEAETGEQGVDLATRLHPNLVLLDIEMPGIGGMAAARRIAGLDPAPSIAFTTAFEGYALAAFDVGAVDYLLKPIADARFAVMLDRVRTVLTSSRPGQFEDHLWVPVRSELRRVALADIERVMAERDYVRIELDGRSHLLRATMDDIAAKLDFALFVRIHRSAIVRRDRVTGLRHDGSGAWSALLITGEAVRIGRTYLDNVRSVLRAGG